MCGIFGYIGMQEAAPILVGGLKKLEYRGYDSAGVAVMNGHRRIHVVKTRGKVKELENLLERRKAPGSIGIGHTRWATHGAPSDRNAHPHPGPEGKAVVVHNGIIENYRELKEELSKDGFSFASDTDSEVISHLVEKFFKKTRNLRAAVASAVACAKGSYAIGVLHAEEPGLLVAARKDSPLLVGYGKGENFISSDPAALLDRTREVLALEDGELAEIRAGEVRIQDFKGRPVRRLPRRIDWDVAQAEKQGFEHFMLKEIFEQPEIIQRILDKRLGRASVDFEELKISANRLKRVRKIVMVACGTSYHAGLVARYAFEALTPFPVAVDHSSEFRYRDPKVDAATLVIVISQSGETADTLAALREAKKKKCLTLAVCNVLGSSMEREAHGVLYTCAGPEIAVASTKAYTAQLATLYLLAFYLRGLFGGAPSKVSVPALLKEFKKIPSVMRQILKEYQKERAQWEANVHQFNVRYHEQLEKYFRADPGKRMRAPNAFFLYLGRNINYPSAMEGALKLKEIAYISAEGYAAGEMKHGPIALIDENPWVIAIAVKSATHEKMVSNIEEILARGGMVTAIVTRGDRAMKQLGLYLYIEVPETPEIFSPLAVALPLQLIAYSVAKEFGEEIDQPRNLAKSVTVE